MVFYNKSNNPRIPAALQLIFLESARGNHDVVKPPPLSTFKTGEVSTTPLGPLLRMHSSHNTVRTLEEANQQPHQESVPMKDKPQQVYSNPTEDSDTEGSESSSRAATRRLVRNPDTFRPLSPQKQSSWAEHSLDDTLPLEVHCRPCLNNKGARRVKSADGAPKTTSLLDNSSHSRSGAVLSSPRRQPRHASMSPQQYLDGMMRNRGYSVECIPALSTAYRNKPTPLQKASYHLYLIKLVKTCPPSALHQMMSVGLSPNPCNSYGESLLHMVCRYNKVAHLQVLLEHCGTDLQVCDDFGRLPLHDAW